MAYGFLPLIPIVTALVAATAPAIGKALGPKTAAQQRAKLARLVTAYQTAKTEKKREKLLSKIAELSDTLRAAAPVAAGDSGVYTLPPVQQQTPTAPPWPLIGIVVAIALSIVLVSRTRKKPARRSR